MNTLPPAFSLGQTNRYPRFLTEPEAPDPLERWKHLQSSDATILARTVWHHVHDAIHTGAFRAQGARSLVESYEVLSGRVYALLEGVSRHLPGARRHLVQGAMLSSDHQAIFCAIVERRCRQGLGSEAAIVDDGPAMLRLRRFVEQRTHETYRAPVAFVARLLAESVVVDVDELCADHLKELSGRLRALVDLAPELRADLLTMPLDPETRALALALAASSSTP